MFVMPSRSQPPGFKVDKYLVILDYPAAGGVSASGSAYINKGDLLFKFYSFHDDVRIGVRLTDSGHHPVHIDIEAEYAVDRNSGEYFLWFGDFPPAYTKDNVHCYFELRLTNDTPNRKDIGTAINAQLLYRP
jgi:hypothetical protein